MNENIVSCIECKCEFPSKGIFTHFLHKHEGLDPRKNTGKGTTKFLKYCCCISCKQEVSTSGTHLKTCGVKLADPIKTCQKCNTQHSKAGKFCSRTCANSRNHTNESRMRIKNTINKKHQSGQITNKRMCIFSICEICNVVIRNSNNKACSELCRGKLFQNAGKKSAASTVKRSKDEIELFNLCQNYFNKVTSNDTSIANGWDADILIHDHKIAILWNGPWHYQEMGFSNHSLLQVQNRDIIKTKEFETKGWKVLVFEDREFTSESAFHEIKSVVGYLGNDPSVQLCSSFTDWRPSLDL